MSEERSREIPIREQKLIDRYEPLKSVVNHYLRFTDNKVLANYLISYMRDIKLDGDDRDALFHSFFTEKSHESKVKRFIYRITKQLNLDHKYQVLRRLIHQIREESEPFLNSNKHKIDQELYICIEGSLLHQHKIESIARNVREIGEFIQFLEDTNQPASFLFKRQLSQTINDNIDDRWFEPLKVKNHPW